MWKPASPYPGKGLGKSGGPLYPDSPQSKGSAKSPDMSGPRGAKGGRVGGARKGGPARAGLRTGRRGEATRAGDLIKGVVKDAGLDQLGQVERLGELWRKLVGAETASKSRIASFKGGVLMIEVANSGLGQELSVYLKRDLLKKLRSESGLKITNLRCRVGGWSDS